MPLDDLNIALLPASEIVHVHDHRYGRSCLTYNTPDDGSCPSVLETAAYTIYFGPLVALGILDDTKETAPLY